MVYRLTFFYNSNSGLLAMHSIIVMQMLYIFTILYLQLLAELYVDREYMSNLLKDQSKP